MSGFSASNCLIGNIFFKPERKLMRHFQCCDLRIGKDPQVPGSSGARLTGMGVGLQSKITQLEPTQRICSRQESKNKSAAFCSHLPAKSAAAQLEN